jgi:hypothetical protein
VKAYIVFPIPGIISLAWKVPIITCATAFKGGRRHRVPERVEVRILGLVYMKVLSRVSESATCCADG